MAKQDILKKLEALEAQAKKGAKEGLKVEPNLILFENGQETKEVLEIYKEIRDNK